MDEILSQDYTYLLSQTGEEILQQNALYVQVNNFKFASCTYGNSGIISISEIVR